MAWEILKRGETRPHIYIPSIQKIPRAQPCPSLPMTYNIKTTQNDPSLSAQAKKLGLRAQLVGPGPVPKRDLSIPAIL